MAKYDVYAKYKENNREFFKKTENKFKSYVKLKFGYVKNKTKELEKFKRFIQNINKRYVIGDCKEITQISGIYTDCKKLRKHIEKLPKYSFAIWSKIKLKAPYFSKDDDEFYIIQNPILKETNFKVPMVRGSSIKGALLHSAIDILNEEVNIENLKSFFRIFGVGNDTFRAIFKKEGIDKNQLQLFLAFEIGINPDKNLEEAFEKYKQSKAQKGRAIFYPIFFDKLSLEVINPHDRKTKAGTKPIYYEVVPKDSESTLQIIYIPFDAILEDDKKIQKEAKQDLEFLTKCIERLSKNGLGAKTKLGWGRFTYDIKTEWSKS